MAAIKIVRRKNKQRKDGTTPLALRIRKIIKLTIALLGNIFWRKIGMRNMEKLSERTQIHKRSIIF